MMKLKTYHGNEIVADNDDEIDNKEVWGSGCGSTCEIREISWAVSCVSCVIPLVALILVAY